MIVDIILFYILALWIFFYRKIKKLLLSLPYLLMIFITPFYNILDRNIFVKIFGCGCVPSTQTNMFNIDFNANDLRMLAYSIITIIAISISIHLSKKLKNKTCKIIYILTIITLNILLGLKICQLYMWA